MAKQIGEILEEIQALAKKNKFKEIIKILSDLAYVSGQRNLPIKCRRNTRKTREGSSQCSPCAYITICSSMCANQSIVYDLNMIKSPYSDKWMYESYPDKYGDKRGSMCPFSLFLMYSYYPYLVGSTYTAIDRFHTLLDHLEKQLSEAPHQEQVTVSRIICVGLLVADILLSEQKLLDALDVLLRLRRGYGKEDHATNAMLAVVYRQMGDIANAQKHIEIAIETDSPYTIIYRAIHCALNGDFDGANSLFNTYNEENEGQETSRVSTSFEQMLVNNMTVALFYVNRISAAKAALDSCKNVCKNARVFRGIMQNNAMLKALTVDLDSKYVDEDPM
ncbi:trafficking protein particle complex subunit 12, putative [Babesia caballi]|uniref:Trafficking protein particle complex subunit 12, putative n=1 Tax=Babesia caballi TaxID=5871 RepID=A0AAV4M039_BABCB|nr:trafficking protein particle complex subunit 12, putative [Babesia caballi]